VVGSYNSTQGCRHVSFFFFFFFAIIGVPSQNCFFFIFKFQEVISNWKNLKIKIQRKGCVILLEFLSKKISMCSFQNPLVTGEVAKAIPPFVGFWYFWNGLSALCCFRLRGLPQCFKVLFSFFYFTENGT
jgi:hypothetical protein